MLVKCLLVIVCAWRVTWGCRPKAPKANQPPTIECPSLKGDYIADRKTTYAKVTWSSPTVSDAEDKSSDLTLSLKSGKASGEFFGQGSHSVTYVVTDKGGLSNFCSFSFVVKVKTCRIVQSISNGQHTCSGIIFGDDCTFSCNEGYELKGESTIYCQKNEKWSAALPHCLAKECPKLKLPKHGVDHICTKKRRFESICWLICDEDNGYAPSRGQWTQCTKDQTWTNLRMTCIDVEPPVIKGCPAETVFQTKQPGSTKTEVKWSKITATDNSGETIVVKSPNGAVSPSGGTFREGTELVRFSAKDSEGNQAEPCFFIVNVQSVKCDPPNFEDENLDTDCIDFDEGKICKLKCYLAIKLKGSKHITCTKDPAGGREARGYWDWGQFDVPAAEKPYCEVHNCTALRAPNYGAIVCDEWTKGTQCQLQCREEYDIPDTVAFSANLYLCSMVTGRWNRETVPDCTYREYGEKLRLPEYYYFYGSCSAAKLEIIENFLHEINVTGACPEIQHCTLENVNVRCGDEPEDEFLDEDEDDFREKRSALRDDFLEEDEDDIRKKRSALRDDFLEDDEDDFRKKRSALRDRRRNNRRGNRRGSRRRGRRPTGGRRRRPQRKGKPQYISFNIVLPSKKSGTFSEVVRTSTRELKIIAKRIAKTKFKVRGRLIEAESVRIRAPLPVCRQGLKIGFFHKDSCVPCLEGSYHNVKRDECEACPLGQYQAEQGQVKCDRCPPGQTTVTIANIDQTACTEMCRPGHHSKNGVVPCFACLRGTYQDRQNATSCHRCPVGLTTEASGAVARSQCIPYDMLLQGPVSVPMEGNSPSPICDFTFAVWIKQVETIYGGIKFEIYSPITAVGLDVVVSSFVQVYIGKNHHTQVNKVVASDWVHVAVVWSQKVVTIYIGGTPVHTQPLPGAPACPSPASSVMRVEIRDHAYMYLRDLNFLTEAKPEIIKTLSTTCSSYLEKSLFSLEQMDMLTLSSVNEVIPSTCLRPDVCSTHPCGKNICIPRGDSFRCACRGGYSGEKCEIPPDLCKDNICRNGATCIVSGSNYKCHCRPGFRGLLCEDKIADGGWTKWMEWGACSRSCGRGFRIRHRFCTNPPPDREGKNCVGRKRQRDVCHKAACPQCDVSTLVVGEGIIPDCQKKGESITCSVTCELGKVFPEKPFNYTCKQGIWTPTRQTVSCTDPVTPLTTGINYTVVFDNSLSSHGQVKNKLDMVGNSFQCARSGGCSITSASSACSDRVEVCDNYDGDYYGSLIVEKQVPTGQINILKVQENKRMSNYLSPLFATWNVFTHTSEEAITPEHRALEMSINSNKLMVYPFDSPSLAVEVSGQFGTLLKTWKYLDDTNWEVRNESYKDFDMSLGPRRVTIPNFLSAKQIMTCPSGSVQGGVFCMKCPPGKMYADKQCSPCRHGFFQNEAGMSSCKACPGFQTTELVGNPTQNQCRDSRMSELKMLLGLHSPGFGVFDPQTRTYKTITLTLTTGKMDYLTYNPRDGFIYYSTLSPPTIGRITIDGKNEVLLSELPPGTRVTGLDVDVGANLLIYTTYTGMLAALHITSGAEHILLSNLTKPRDLVLDQNRGVYWVESSSIKHVKYSSKVAHTVVKDTYAIWNLILNKEDGKILWQSYSRLRTAYINGSKHQTLATHFTSRFGYTDDYYFHIDSVGRLIRVNKDLSATATIFSLPSDVVRMWMVNTTDNTDIDNLCSESRSDCDHGCFPVNETSRQCFCALEYTLQKDYKTCRSDFSALLNTSDPRAWSKPPSSDYSVPPSMTLRLKVLACHSARVALAENNRRLYQIDLGQKRGNVTEMSIKKISPRGAPIVLVRKEIDLLDCNSFKTFWITWKEKKLRVGSGEQVGKNQHLVASDFRPYNVNYVMFGTRFNATALWQF